MMMMRGSLMQCVSVFLCRRACVRSVLQTCASSSVTRCVSLSGEQCLPHFRRQQPRLIRSRNTRCPVADTAVVPRSSYCHVHLRVILFACHRKTMPCVCETRLYIRQNIITSFLALIWPPLGTHRETRFFKLSFFALKV